MGFSQKMCFPACPNNQDTFTELHDLGGFDYQVGVRVGGRADDNCLEKGGIETRLKIRGPTCTLEAKTSSTVLHTFSIMFWWATS